MGRREQDEEEEDDDKNDPSRTSVAARIQMFEQKSPRHAPVMRPRSPSPLPATLGNSDATPAIEPPPEQPEAENPPTCITFAISTPMEGARSRSVTPGTHRRITQLTEKLEETTNELELAHQRTLESDAAREALLKELNEYKLQQRTLEERLGLMQTQLFQVTAAVAESNARSSSDAAPPTSGNGSPTAQFEVWSLRTEENEDKEKKDDDRDTFHDAEEKGFVLVTGDED